MKNPFRPWPHLWLAPFIFVSLNSTGCSWFQGKSGSETSTSEVAVFPKKVMLPAPQLAPKDHELLRLTRYLEQADAVHREAWWVVASEKKVPGKTIFGKIQRALAQELKLKIANKSLFSCDRYTVKREILSAKGYPQKGQVFESCRSKEAAVHLADFEMKTATDANLVFQGQNLGELLGLGTAILNRNIRCAMKGDEEGKLTDLICEDFSQDRSSTESLRFTVYEYHREGKSLLKLRGQVVEALYATRKFQADVPLEGKIEVVETQTLAPENPPPAVAPVVPAALPQAPRVLPADPDSQRRRQLEQNPEDYHVEEAGTGAPPTVREGSRAQPEVDSSVPATPQADVMPLTPEEELEQNPNATPAPPPVLAPPLAPSAR